MRLILVCPTFFPRLILPSPLKLGIGQEITCVSPEARPALNVQMLIDSKQINVSMSTLNDLNHYYVTTASTSEITRNWNGKPIKCCFFSECCGRLCRPADTLNLECKFQRQRKESKVLILYILFKRVSITQTFFIKSPPRDDNL